MIVEVPLGLIDDNPFQTRSVYAEAAIQELAESIEGLRPVREETSGLIHVPPARAVDALDGTVVDARVAMVAGAESMETYRFQLAAGHSRMRAFRLLAEGDGGDDGRQWATMPLDVAVLDDQAMADVAWSENQKRRDLSAVEEGRAISSAMEMFGWTQAEVGERWGLSRSAVANKVRLLGLPAEIQERVVSGEIGERVARALLPALDVPDALQSGLAAIEAGKASDVVEDRVSWVLVYRSQKLADEPFPPQWPGKRHGLEVRPCVGCEDRRKVRREWRCFGRKCLAEKRRVWNEVQVGQAIEAMEDQVGTPLVAYKAYDWNMVEFGWDEPQAIFKQTCKPGCRHGRLGLLALVPAHTRGHGVKADGGEAWFVCDKLRCMMALKKKRSGQSDGRAKEKTEEKRKRELVKSVVGLVLDELGGLGEEEMGKLASHEPLMEFLVRRLGGGISDGGLQRWCRAAVGAADLSAPGGFWEVAVMAWLASMAGYVWHGSDVEGTLTPAVDGLWEHLGRRDVSGETGAADESG